MLYQEIAGTDLDRIRETTNHAHVQHSIVEANADIGEYASLRWAEVAGDVVIGEAARVEHSSISWYNMARLLCISFSGVWFCSPYT